VAIEHDGGQVRSKQLMLVVWSLSKQRNFQNNNWVSKLYTFKAKVGNMPAALLQPNLSRSDFVLENRTNPLQSMYFAS
jgi:hypothetical protein